MNFETRQEGSSVIEKDSLIGKAVRLAELFHPRVQVEWIWPENAVPKKNKIPVDKGAGVS